MKIRNGFVSNSSSSSFIVYIKKPIEKTSYEEFKEWLELDKYKPDCDDIETSCEQLYEATLNSNLTELEKFKCDYSYQVTLGDLMYMKHLEKAYELMQEYPSVFMNTDCVKIANPNIVIIDLCCQL